MRYIVGFMFNNDSVALIRKSKPEWQYGFLNGIGGKVNDKESPLNAMIREFEEETGYKTFRHQWRSFCLMGGTSKNGEKFYVDFFCTTGDLSKLISVEKETIEIHNVKDVLSGKEKIISNLYWLIPLALDFLDGDFPPGTCTVTL